MSDANDDSTSIGNDEKFILGYVYLLKRFNNDNIVKIGYTSKSAAVRAVNYTDGEWIVHKEYSMPVWLARLTEQTAHSKLSHHWLDPKLTGGTASEIFTCSLETACAAIESAHIEQLEISLSMLGVPRILNDFIVNKQKLTSKEKFGVAEEKTDALLYELISENIELKDKTLLLEGELDRVKIRAADTIKLSDAREKGLLEKISSLETINKKYETIESISIGNFGIEIEALERLANNKINLKDFEILRDGFRRAIDILHRIKMSEYKK